MLAASEVQLRVNYPDLLLHRRCQVKGWCCAGKFHYPLAAASWPWTNLQGELRIRARTTPGRWTIFVPIAGATSRWRGQIAHAPNVRTGNVRRRRKRGSGEREAS